MPFSKENDGCHPQFKDAVCIDAGKVYDSCMERDCLEDLRVFFGECDQEAIGNAVGCRVKSANILDVLIDVEPVNFNRGFFSCDLTFFFKIKAEAVMPRQKNPRDITGICAFEKKVILCGSEGNVKIFSSRTKIGGEDEQNEMGTNLPECKVQCVEPVLLDSKICEMCSCCEPLIPFPGNVLRVIDGEAANTGNRALFVSLGLFSIVQLVRDVQMLVPVFDFCIPEKECMKSAEEPCEMFSKLKFPTEEFFPEGCKK